PERLRDELMIALRPCFLEDVPQSAPLGRLLSRSGTRSSGTPRPMRIRRFQRLRAQGKELLDERGAALGGLLNLPSLFQGRAVFLEAHHEKIGAAEDCGEHVVQIMRDASRQPSHGSVAHWSVAGFGAFKYLSYHATTRFKRS